METKEKIHKYYRVGAASDTTVKYQFREFGSGSTADDVRSGMPSDVDKCKKNVKLCWSAEKWRDTAYEKKTFPAAVAGTQEHRNCG